jgi:hypothetical protein
MAGTYKFCSVERTGKDGNIYIVTMTKKPENRLTVESCQELIYAYRKIVSRQDVVERTLLKGRRSKSLVQTRREQ